MLFFLVALVLRDVEHTAELEGFVHDRKGRPVTTGHVTACGQAKFGHCSEPPPPEAAAWDSTIHHSNCWCREAAIDSKGHYLIKGLTESVTVRAIVAGSAEVGPLNDSIALARASRTQLNLTVEKGHTVRGVVLKADGAAAANAHVFIETSIFMLKTGPDGTFEAKGVLAGERVVIASSSSTEPVKVTVTVPTTQKRITVRLP